MRIVVLVVVTLLLAGCGTTTQVVTPAEHPRLDQPSADLTKDCSWPALAKAAGLTQEETETLLRTNARAQIDCAKRFKLLRDFYKKRDAALQGTKPTGGKKK